MGGKQKNQGYVAMKRILIVDDEAFLLQGLSRALQNSSTSVTMVETGADALAEVASANYHLCLLDLFLPDLDGIVVLEKIKKISPQTKVVIMTAGVVNNYMKNVIEENAYMFITKPFELIEIRLITKRALAGADQLDG